MILIGEMRDEETMRTALAAAETGHLVLSTLHTIDAHETIDRVLDLFPSDAEQQARSMLAGALKGIVSQRLVTTGRRATAVRRGHGLDRPRAGLHHGPRETDRQAQRGDRRRRVLRHADVRPGAAAARPGGQGREDDARARHPPHDFKLLLASEGRTSTSMDDVGDAACNGHRPTQVGV